MLRRERELRGLEVQAVDGAIGHVEQFYFDDVAWVVRYVAVGTGNRCWSPRSGSSA
jgi:hypothetical protein